MNNAALVIAIVVVVWLVPPVVMWLRGRMNWAGCALWLPVISLLILVKVVRQPATPNSWWAERFYGENMMEVARKRFPIAAVSGTRSESIATRQEWRSSRRQRKEKRRLRRRTRRAKVKAKRKRRLRPSDAVAEAKARDEKEKGE